jgi:hypothetical protein
MSEEKKEHYKLSGILSVPQLAAIGVGVLYVSGYYINSIFLRNYGISDSELFKLEYIKIGFVFSLITFGLVFLPFGAFFLTYKVRKASQLPHYHVGAIGNSLNVIFFLGVPLFLAFFATRHDWLMSLSSTLFCLQTFQQVVIAFLLISAFGVVVLPYIERVLSARTEGAVLLNLYRFIVEPVRYGILLVSLYLLERSFAQLPWIPSLFSRCVYYVLAALVFVVGMSGALWWIKHIREIKGYFLVYPLICFGLAILYYMAIASYEFGLYTHIPCNRGGRLPLTEAYMEIRDHDGLFAKERTVAGVKLRGPAYIIEETSDCYYVASEHMENWLTDFVPIHSIRRDNVPYVFLEIINDGFPRTKRP